MKVFYAFGSFIYLFIVLHKTWTNILLWLNSFLFSKCLYMYEELKGLVMDITFYTKYKKQDFLNFRNHLTCYQITANNICTEIEET